MTSALFVLWLYFSAPWSWGPLPMTPGWSSVAVLDEEGCAAALARVQQPAFCASAEGMSWPLARHEEEP